MDPDVPVSDRHRSEKRTRVELVDRHAGARERVADVAMFKVTGPGTRLVTCRVQLFTAEGLRPVVVATQLSDEGASLINVAESFAAEVWRRLVPQEQESPLVVTLLLSEGLPDGRAAKVVDHLDLVECTVTGPHRLVDPLWYPLHPTELDHLVGADVDLTRGPGYRPRARDPEPVFRLDARSLVGLPPTEPFRAACMARPPVAPGRSSRHRALLSQQDRPAPVAGRTCCWYHGGDWHYVSGVAVDLLEQARRRGAAPTILSTTSYSTPRTLSWTPGRAMHCRACSWPR